MELGRGKLPRTKVDALFQAIHPVYGLAWTDGKAVYLTSLSYFSGTIFGDETVKLIDLKSEVIGACWSNQESSAYLAVQCATKTTIWSVSGSVQEVQLKLVAEFEVKALMKGVFWHPYLPIVCILTKSSVEIVRVEPLFRETVQSSSEATAGAWSQDAKKLLISKGTSLLSIEFNEAEKSFTTKLEPVWQIPGLDGRVSSMVAMDNNHVLVAASLPLDRLLTQSQEDMFEVPGSLRTSLNSGEGVECKKVKVDSCDIDVSGNGPIDLTALVAAKRQGGVTQTEDSVKTREIDEEIVDIVHVKRNASRESSLLKFQRKDTELQDTSVLLMISTTGLTPAVVSRISVPGILDPDLISYQRMNQTIAVSSNAQSKIQIFRVQQEEIKKVEDLDLGRDSRPKGFSSTMDGKDLLILVGKLVNSNTAFPPSGQLTEYELCLRYHTVAIAPPEVIPRKEPCPQCTLKLPDGGVLERPCDHLDDEDEVDQGPGAGLTPAKYPTIYNAGLVHFLHYKNGNALKKTLVLVDGLIKLETIKEAFHLSSVEIVYGNSVIVLSSDKDGYVPLTFEPNKTWTVTGRRAPKQNVE